MLQPGGLGALVRRLDTTLGLLVAVLVVLSLALWLMPGFPGVSDARALDIAINVAAVLVGAAVAILAWVRWRETGGTVALYQTAAFVALTMTNAVQIGIVLVGRERELGLAAEAPGEAGVYLWTLTRFTAATLLVLGAARSLRRDRPPLRPVVIALGPTATVLAAALMLFAREAALPPVPGTAELGFDGRPLLSPESAAVGVFQVGIFAIFIAAALLFRQLYLRDRLVSHAFLAVGLVVAAFSQLHFGIEPVVAIGVVTSADALRLAFYAILFMGIQAELASDLTALRRANVELRRLADVDSANAILAERARLAREIHDGLAQDLYYAKLTQTRLAGDAALDDRARGTAREVLSVLDSALSEARQAVMALRAQPTGTSLEDVLREYVHDFGDRFGMRAEFRAEGALDRLPARTEAEALRIVQEALNNVRRHADATLVRVTAEQHDGHVRLTIRDNGRGFDPSSVGDDRYGLRGMRERADLVGGTLAVESRPSDGTRVALELPLETRAGEGRP